MPYTTCAPTASSRSAQLMLASSSKRAFSSTTASHLLAAPRRLDQQVHQQRLAAGAVDGLLDRQHVGVLDRLAQQLHHRLEALERVVQQHVALASAACRRSTRRAAAGPWARRGS